MLYCLGVGHSENSLLVSLPLGSLGYIRVSIGSDQCMSDLESQLALVQSFDSPSNSIWLRSYFFSTPRSLMSPIVGLSTRTKHQAGPLESEEWGVGKVTRFCYVRLCQNRASLTRSAELLIITSFSRLLVF